MRKFTFAAISAVAAATFFSCGNGTPKANLQSDIDTLSYAIGMAQTNGLKPYLVGNLGVDTAYMADFIKGLNDGANAGDDKRKAAYYAGIQIGQQIANQMVKGINRQLFDDDSTQTISLKNFMAGFITATTEKPGVLINDTALDMERAQKLTNELMEKVQSKAMEKRYGENKKAGEEYIAKYKKGADVKVLPSGVAYKVIKEGTGELPKDTSKVKVQYEGKTIDGKVFDSSYTRNAPAEFKANQVIAGWTEALTHMPVGSVWEVVIPQEQAYQGRKLNGIDPFSTLIFKIELLDIMK